MSIKCFVFEICRMKCPCPCFFYELFCQKKIDTMECWCIANPSRLKGLQRTSFLTKIVQKIPSQIIPWLGPWIMTFHKILIHCRIWSTLSTFIKISFCGLKISMTQKTLVLNCELILHQNQHAELKYIYLKVMYLILTHYFKVLSIKYGQTVCTRNLEPFHM